MKFLNRLHSPDQRSTYRVQAGGEDARLRVGLPSGPVEAELNDISSRGGGFSLPASTADEIEKGAEIILRLEVGGPAMPQLFIRAIVRNKIVDQECVRVGVEFVDPDRLYAQLKEPQWLFFNRRRAFRVRPTDAHGRPLRAKFSLPERSKPRSIALYDLSSTGLSVDLRPENRVEFPADSPIRVTFMVPLDGVEADLRVLLVHRTSIQGRKRVGFHIDIENTPDAESQAETILRYVLDQQQKLISRS